MNEHVLYFDANLLPGILAWSNIFPHVVLIYALVVTKINQNKKYIFLDGER